jgi:predicted secreted hydrolase
VTGKGPIIKLAPSYAVANFLNSIPVTDRPAAIFPDLLAAAKGLTNARPDRAAGVMAVMRQLLDTAANYGIDAPAAPPVFPADHAMHLNWGVEWYYLIANLQAKTGERIGVFIDFARDRAVSLDVQQQGYWTDEDAQVGFTMATVVVASRNGSSIARRRTNAHWPIKEPGSLAFSKPGAPFQYRCSPDVISSPSEEVLPLTWRVNDAPNMNINLTVSSALSPDNAFFRQGKDGLTTGVFPGMYYSWPQLRVEGTVTTGGKTYEVTGTGWVDHQSITKRLANPSHDLFQGWSWCAFNFSDGRAFTAAGLQIKNVIEPTIALEAGFVVEPDGGNWRATPIALGVVDLEAFTPMLHNVRMPTAWTWKTFEADRTTPKIQVRAASWNQRCDFEPANMVVISEAPVEVRALKDGAVLGSGYCESMSYEAPADYQARALAYLRGGGSWWPWRRR